MPGRRRHPRGPRAALTAAACAALLLGPPPTAQAADDRPGPRPVAGDVTGAVTGDIEVHDPSAIRLEDGTYVVYSTHNGIEARTSTDGVHWKRAGSAFRSLPAWWRAYSAESDPWAPEVLHRGGTYWLYYAVSSFGSNHSAIGLATSPTGLPGTWEDGGVVFSSTTTDDYNAIDPGVVEGGGRLWMSFGSHWTGIRMVELDRRTGTVKPGAPVHHLATRPDAPYAVEAPSLVKRGAYYYLFVSYDRCCAGTDSTYNIRVGRATSPTGPYTDRDGTPMTEGGGELLLASQGRYVGPGGQSVLRDRGGRAGRDVLVHHYYDAEDGGVPKLALRTLRWDDAGWPAVGR
ncbi:arabinan endo-1,5-alpha-L-arabinosidase [Streptomyces sp. NPDC006307]|uniref:arabinan endo-1,5-alpha-L-arabinosidase n=1 Tax=Streptomyces sp. NPDC006307 TaxID=3156748 RepID=UPI0033BD1646